MPSIFESKKILNTASMFDDLSKRMSLLFPDLEWDLKKAGHTINATQYISVSIYITLIVFITILLLMSPIVIKQGAFKLRLIFIFSAVLSSLSFVYMLFVPKSVIHKRGRLIDKDLEYMLKDMQIQLSSGVPLFDTLVNIGRGRYGECSSIANGIIQEVESGKAMTEVLDDVGMWSPSEYLRKVLWQIVNAVKSGSNIQKALEAISNDIRVDKENKIKQYGQELNLWGLIYMMAAVIVPSMGLTLLVILSSFMGSSLINKSLFWFIFILLIIFQMAFITFVKSKRPII